MNPGFDRLSAVLSRFPISAQLFHAGPLCGVTQFDARPGRAFLHVLRRGSTELLHHPRSGVKRRIMVAEPSLIFYPHSIFHELHNAPSEGSDFTCASVHFSGDQAHPLVCALPKLLVLPLERVAGLQATLALLFEETSAVRCGQQEIASRLFEVLLLRMLRWLLDAPEQSGVLGGLLYALADPALQKALHAMHQQPEKAWTLEALASCAEQSRSVFAERFKQVMGTGAISYLGAWRLSLAQQALMQGQPLKRVAINLGFADTAALSRSFSKRFGCSPREWLAQQR